MKLTCKPPDIHIRHPPNTKTLSEDSDTVITTSIMVVSDPSNVKIYTVNGAANGSASSLPDWLSRKRAAAKGTGKRATRELTEGTIELIQGFEFPEASNRIKTTRDGHHAIATGTYKPQMKVWDLDQLSQKFERHSDAENVDFIVRESFENVFHSRAVESQPITADLVGRLDEINTPPK